MWLIIAVNCDFLPSKSFQLNLKWEITHLSNIRENSKNILRLCDNRLDGVWLPGTAAPTHVLSPSGSVVVVSPLLRGRSSDSMLWRKVTVRIRKGSIRTFSNYSHEMMLSSQSFNFVIWLWWDMYDQWIIIISWDRNKSLVSKLTFDLLSSVTPLLCDFTIFRRAIRRRVREFRSTYTLNYTYRRQIDWSMHEWEGTIVINVAKCFVVVAVFQLILSAHS